MAAFAPLCLPVGCAAIGNTRALTAGMTGAPAATDTPAVSESFAVIIVPTSGGGDQSREQLDRLLGTARPERLEPRAAEDEAGPVATIALNMVVMDRFLHMVFTPAYANRGWMLDPSRKSRASRLLNAIDARSRPNERRHIPAQGACRERAKNTQATCRIRVGTLTHGAFVPRAAHR